MCRKVYIGLTQEIFIFGFCCQEEKIYFLGLLFCCADVKYIIICSIYNTGSGKTTLVQKVVDALQKNGLTVQGFYTEEVRQHGKRTGFDVATLDGTRGALARVGYASLFIFNPFTFIIMQNYPHLMI
jgi:hypothetical protein